MITHGNSNGNGNIQGTPSVAVRQWSNLPDDLLCTIYLRLNAELDRVRFDAVCTPWRATASHPQRRVIPWLILDPSGETQHVYCPQDGPVLVRLPFLDEAAAAGKSFVGGHEGGWIASSEAPFRIINLFCGAEVALPGEHTVNRIGQAGDPLVLRKIIFSEQPTSNRCILAGITDKHKFAFSPVGFAEAGWTVHGFYIGEGLMDIAFCNGELYGIMRHTARLIKYEFGVDEHGAPVIMNIHWLCVFSNHRYGRENTEEHARYIVELGGKLLMVGRNPNWWPRCLRNAGGTRFTVHELVDTDVEMSIRNITKYKWVEVNTLGEHALFLGPTCSKEVHIPASGCGDVRRNHIYFSHHPSSSQKHEIPSGAKVVEARWDSDDLVYYKEEESTNGGVQGIMSVGYYVMGGVCPPM